MNQEPLSQLSEQLQTFNKLESTDATQTITEAYHHILTTVQAIMLDSDNPDAHARAWTLVNDDAYKDLSDIEGGRKEALPDLKIKINQLGELLLDPDRRM